MPYRIEYSPDALDHLRGLTARQQRIVVDGIATRLTEEPTRESRNRKPMRPNPLAPWELRLGALRVYYDIAERPRPVVRIRAVGIKERARVRIGNEIIDL